MAIMHLNFFSQYLVMNTDLNIILPNSMDPNKYHAKDSSHADPNFYRSGKKYKVLLLLHGRWEDYTSWLRLTNIEQYATENDLIVVMPSGYNSNWTDWPTYGLLPKMYDYLMEEVMPLVHNWLPGSDKKEDNFVVGHSMGGCGATRLLLSYPDKFAAGASISSNERPYPMFYEKNLEKGNTSITNWIDNAGGIENFMASRENVRGHIEKLVAEGKIGEIPPIYISAGANDDAPHIKQFHSWVEFCEQHGLKVTSHLAEGYGHDWRYFDKEIRNILKFFGFDMSKFENEGKEAPGAGH